MPATDQKISDCPSGTLAPSGEPAKSERSPAEAAFAAAVMRATDLHHRQIAAIPAMIEALREIEFIFDGQEDIDGNGGPNDAMKALTAVRAALAKATE